ncbi:MAG: hypothetical protein HDR88_11885 [Bacteroides sp.]|nr:hypothetical protein [Bacteroides sp.]
MCAAQEEEVFLPGSQLYKDLNDYESVIGKNVKVLVQSISDRGVVVSHKDFIKDIFERKDILRTIKEAQIVNGTIRGILDRGFFVEVLGIIGFMPIKEVRDNLDLCVNQSIDVAISSYDIDKGSLVLSEKYCFLLKQKAIAKTKREDSRNKAQKALESIRIGDVLHCKIIKPIASGYLIISDNSVRGILEAREIPNGKKYKNGHEINIMVSDLNQGSFRGSVIRLIERKQQDLLDFVSSNITPNETILEGKVVYIERALVTIKITYNARFFFGYIRGKDLAWGKVLNAADSVFLGEELKVKYLGVEDGKFYFDLKWQQCHLYPDPLFDESINGLLAMQGIGSNLFYGKANISTYVSENEEKTIISAYVTDLVVEEPTSKASVLLDPYTGAQISALIPKRYAYALENGKFYRFSLTLADKETRIEQHRLYMCSAEPYNSLESRNPYKLLIEQSFRENKSPKSNRESANYLKEIGADMYTGRDRMFYELLQNADDSASQRGVRMMIQIKDNYLILTHDGLPFSRQDFRSIVSTANSTKRLDSKKTGYKGIGFKSVFTDSNKVYIKTGGFFFCFDKNAEIFNDFRRFYTCVNPLYTNEQLDVFFQENIEYERDFEGVEHLPWQLLPFWQEEIPKELQETSFSRRCNVAIALDLGVTISNYKEIIKGILQKPRFMLFLRNTTRIQFEDKKWNILSIAKQKNLDNDIVCLKNSFADEDKEISYIVRDCNPIFVNNECFNESGIPLRKECVVSAGKEKWKLYQNIDGIDVPVTSIPERIVASDTTTISYAFMLDADKHIKPLSDKIPSLYAYLPMEDRRYLFPFFINADFELSSNRQEAKQSYWNQYLFYNIGLNIPEWLISVAHESSPRYLELLPGKYLTETLEEGKKDMLAVGFNAGLKKSIASSKFILNHEGTLSSVSDVVVDDSGLSYLIGAEAFLKCMNFSQSLVNPELSKASFKKDTLSGIKHIPTEIVVSVITKSKDKYLRLLKRWLKNSEISVCEKMLIWIAQVAENNHQLKSIICDIPCFRVGVDWMSFNEVSETDHTLFNSNAIREAIPLLSKIGLEPTSEQIEEHQFYTLMRDSFFSDCLKRALPKIQARIQAQSDILDDTDIHDIFECVSSESAAKEGVTAKDITELAIIRNRKGQFKKISQMIELDSSKYNGIVDEYVISEKDAVCPGISPFIMPLQQAYDILLLNHWEELSVAVSNEDQAIALYTLASDLYSVRKQQSEKTEDSDFPVSKHYYANGKFFSLNDVYLSRNANLSEPERSVLKKCIQNPIVSSGVLIALKRKPFQIHHTNMDKAISVPFALSQEEMETFLQISKKEHGKFFENFLVTYKDGIYNINALPKDEFTYKTENKILVAFINKYCEGMHLLPSGIHNYCADFPEILTGDSIFTKLYPWLNKANGFCEEFLNIIETEGSPVKREFIGKLTRVDLYDEDEKNSQSVRIIKLLSSIENITDKEYAHVRDKLELVLNEEHIPVVNIRTQRDLSVGAKRFSLSSLLPEEDKNSSVLSSIIARLKASGLSSDFLNSLFDIQIDDNLCEETFNQLLAKPLSNGVQFVFVLLYADANNKTLSGCKILNSNNQEVTLSGTEWIVDAPSFIKADNCFPTQYRDGLDWLTIPFKSKANSITIRREIVDYSILKTVMSDEEKTSLLDYLYNHWQVQKTTPSATNLRYICDGLGISSKYLVLSKEYALQKEQPDSYIHNWAGTKDSYKNGFLEDVLSMQGEESDVVCVRKYLSGKITQPEFIAKSDILSAKIVDWIVEKSLQLNEEQSDWLIQSIFSQSDFSIDTDDDTLKSFSETHPSDLAFDKWLIYRYSSQMPSLIKVSASPAYICRRFHQNNIAVLGNNIFINQDEWHHLDTLLRKLVQLGLGFSAEDYIAFQNYCDNSELNLEGLGGNDSGLDQKDQIVANKVAREAAIQWLQLHGYTVPFVLPEYSCFEGVSKDGVNYPIVVKSFLSYAKKLYLSPNQYSHLLKKNARLMLYTGNNRFYVLSREKILSDKDFLTLRFSVKNLDHDGKLAAIASLLKDEYFEDTQFVFGVLRDAQMVVAHSLDDYNLSGEGSEETISSGNEEDVL